MTKQEIIEKIKRVVNSSMPQTMKELLIKKYNALLFTGENLELKLKELPEETQKCFKELEELYRNNYETLPNPEYCKITYSSNEENEVYCKIQYLDPKRDILDGVLICHDVFLIDLKSQTLRKLEMDESREKTIESKIKLEKLVIIDEGVIRGGKLSELIEKAKKILIEQIDERES